MNAAPEIAFSSEQGKANYAAARRQYPAQAIVDLKTMRDNMAHLVSVVGGPASGTAVMGVVKADAYGHGLLPAALAALAGGATWLGTAQSHEALLLRKLGIGPDRCHILTWVYNGTEVPFDALIAAGVMRLLFSSDALRVCDPLLPWIAAVVLCALFFPLHSTLRFRRGCQD